MAFSKSSYSSDTMNYNFNHYYHVNTITNHVDIINKSGVRIRYLCPNIDTLCYNTTPFIPPDKLYIMNQSDKSQLHYL